MVVSTTVDYGEEAVEVEGRCYLKLFEGNLKREALVVVRVESAFLNRRLLLLDPFSVQQQRDLHVRIC